VALQNGTQLMEMKADTLGRSSTSIWYDSYFIFTPFSCLFVWHNRRFATDKTL
jgi:hypothetical protein